MPSSKNIKEKQREEAVRWHTLLMSGAETESDWNAFTSWLEQDDNQLAYNKLLETMAILDEEKTELLSLADTKETGSPDHSDAIIAISAWKKARSAFRKPQVSALTAIAAAFSLFFVGMPESNTPFETVHYETTLDARRTIELADGSQLHLNVNTSLNVTLSDTERRVSFNTGEALFEVAQNKEKPFFVDVGGQQIRVVGTVFNVLRHKGDIEVTVTEGIVDVTHQTHEQDTAEHSTESNVNRLTAGSQLKHTEGSQISELFDVDPDTITAWKKGLLVYDNELLSVVAYDLNRNFKKQITLGPDTENLRFSGILDLSNQDSVLSLLESTLALKSNKTPSGILLITHDP